METVSSVYSGHSINEHYLSFPQYTGSWVNLFQETYGILLIVRPFKFLIELFMSLVFEVPSYGRN